MRNKHKVHLQVTLSQGTCTKHLGTSHTIGSASFYSILLGAIVVSYLAKRSDLSYPLELRDGFTPQASHGQ
jgi:hypothetical protein